MGELKEKFTLLMELAAVDKPEQTKIKGVIASHCSQSENSDTIKPSMILWGIH